MCVFLASDDLLTLKIINYKAISFLNSFVLHIITFVQLSFLYFLFGFSASYTKA